MRECPWYGNIAQICWIMHQQLRNDMKPKQVHYLCIRWGNDLRKGGGKGEG
jgi:hypothetical protein